MGKEVPADANRLLSASLELLAQNAVHTDAELTLAARHPVPTPAEDPIGAIIRKARDEQREKANKWSSQSATFTTTTLTILGFSLKASGILKDIEEALVGLGVIGGLHTGIGGVVITLRPNRTTKAYLPRAIEIARTSALVTGKLETRLNARNRLGPLAEAPDNIVMHLRDTTGPQVQALRLEVQRLSGLAENQALFGDHSREDPVVAAYLTVQSALSQHIPLPNSTPLGIGQ